jgi:hypothetical protein
LKNSPTSKRHVEEDPYPLESQVFHFEYKRNENSGPGRNQVRMEYVKLQYRWVTYSKNPTHGEWIDSYEDAHEFGQKVGPTYIVESRTVLKDPSMDLSRSCFACKKVTHIVDMKDGLDDQLICTRCWFDERRCTVCCETQIHLYEMFSVIYTDPPVTTPGDLL